MFLKSCKCLIVGFRYGPIFACVSCHETNWEANTIRIEDITTVSLEYIDLNYVSVVHRKLFFKLGAFHLCKLCKRSIDTFKIPKRCAKNLLLCPWEDVDTEILSLNEVSHHLILAHQIYVFYVRWRTLSWLLSICSPTCTSWTPRTGRRL